MNTIERAKYAKHQAEKCGMKYKLILAGDVWFFHGCKVQWFYANAKTGATIGGRKSTFFLKWNQPKSEFLGIVREIAKANEFKRLLVKPGTAADKGDFYYVVVVTSYGRYGELASAVANRVFKKNTRYAIVSKSADAARVLEENREEIGRWMWESDFRKHEGLPEATYEIIECGCDEIAYSKALYPPDRDKWTLV